eukprot:scaffold171824_cov68-Cyclotella_meneghiniana.AAC.3
MSVEKIGEIIFGDNISPRRSLNKRFASLASQKFLVSGSVPAPTYRHCGGCWFVATTWPISSIPRLLFIIDDPQLQLVTVWLNWLVASMAKS